MKCSYCQKECGTKNAWLLHVARCPQKTGQAKRTFTVDGNHAAAWNMVEEVGGQNGDIFVIHGVRHILTASGFIEDDDSNG
jgi:hypothetical protein